MTSVELLTFSMRTEQPKAGSDWFRIVKAKTKSEPTKVYIYDEIGFWGTNAKDFAALLDEIESDDIHVHLNSPGGSVFDGLAIYNTLKNHKSKVTAIVDGMAASAASFILQAADVRQMSRNAQVMIHDAKAYAGGNADQMRKAAELLDRISNEIADIYAVRSGGTKSLEEFRSLMQAGDHWYNGNEAIADGLVDEVTDNPAEEEDAPEESSSNSWTTEEVEAFFKAEPTKLAANASRVTTTNRVEEAHMTGANTQQKQSTPPAPQQPQAPVAQAAPQAPEAPSPVAGLTMLVNGTEVTDFAAVQAHITSLESFKKETIEGGRKSFVAELVASGKILAGEETLTQTENFALSLSNEQFAAWKASMSSAPANPLFAQHGVTGPSTPPANGGAKNEAQERITVLKEIVQSHRDAGVSEDAIQNKDSYKELQNLLATQQTGA